MTIGRWVVAFAITQTVEVPIWFVALRRDGPEALSSVARVELSFAASMLTHPWVWFVFPALTGWLVGLGLGRPLAWNVTVFLAEIFAWLVEARIMARAGLASAMWWSAVANASSYTMGRVLWPVLF